MVEDSFSFTVNFSVESPELPGTVHAYVEYQGRLETRDGKDGAVISILAKGEGIASGQFSFFFGEGDDGEIIYIPTGEPITDFATCLGMSVGSAVVQEAVACWRAGERSWIDFLRCMKGKFWLLSIGTVRSMFSCAGRALGG